MHDDLDVFLAYDEGDADLARELRTALIGAGMRPWCEAVDLIPGELWDEVIPARLKASKVMAVLITRNWPEVGQSNQDHYLPEKVAVAIQHAKRAGTPMIVPVLLRGGDPSRVPFGVTRAARVQLAEDDLPRLAAELKRTVAAASGRPAPESRATARGVEQDAARARRRQDAGERADVVVVTALKDELDALIAQSGLEWQSGTDSHGFPYRVTDLDGLRVVAARTGGMGERDATARAVRLHDQFEPQVLVICGICAGHPDKTALGDVVVAGRVFNFEQGSVGPSGALAPDQQTFDLRPQWRVHAEDLAAEPTAWLGDLARQRPPTLRWLADDALLKLHTTGEPQRVQSDDKATRRQVWQRLLDAGLITDHPPQAQPTDDGKARAGKMAWYGGPLDDPPFRAHMGAMATGSAVRRDLAVWDQVLGLQRKTLAVEMESTAIGALAHQQRLDFLAVKGVSDHADAHKDDRFRDFAARASAAFVLAFLRQHVEPRLVVLDGRVPLLAAAPGPRPWFDAEEIEELVSAYISRPLSRDLLLAWIDSRIVGGLKTERSPAAQVRADLMALNTLRLGEAGAEPPLAKWLTAAVRLSGPLTQANVYQKALDTLRARIAARG